MKKILLIITMLVLGIGSTWAAFEDITVYATQRITNLGGKYYTIHYKFTNGNTYPVIVDGTTLKCANTTSATPAVFYFNLADDKGFYKVKETSTNTFWKFDRNLGSKDDAVNIQIFPGQNDGTYRICGLTTDETNNKNSRCYLAEGNGNALNYNSREWENNAENGKISVQVASNSGTYCSEVVLTEVFVEAQALTSGWYRVRVSNSGDITQNYITTKEENIAEGDYPAKSAAQGTNIGATFMYFEVGNDARNKNGACGKWIHVRDSKGRYMTREATSSISAPDQICCVYSSSSAKQKLVFTNGTDSGTDQANTRYSWQAYNNYIGLSAANTYNIFYAAQAGEDYINNAYKVKVLVGADGSETISYNGAETHYGFSTVYNNGTFFFAQGVTPSANDFTFDKGTNTNYSDNPGFLVDSENKTITVLPYANRDVDVPSGYNGYIGGNTDISETEWKTQEYWSLSDNWNNYGPGCSVSGSAQGMWNPIYLQGITGGTVPALDGWNFRMIADHSTYEIASVGKIQGGMDCYFTLKNTSVVTMNFGTGHTFNFTINLNEGTGNILNFVMSNGYQCTTNSCTECPSRSTITVNYGDVTKDTNRQFNASGSGNIKKLVLNATLTDPAEYNKEESIVLATLNSVSVTDVEKNISDAGWTEVNNYDLLKTQNTTGKFYYIEESISNGVKQYTLHTYKQIVYTVESDKNFSEIYSDKDFANFKFIYIPSGKKLIFDTTLEDKELTSTQMIKAESGTSVIQINEGVTLYTNNIISGQTPTIIGAGTFKTTTYTTSVPLNVTLGDDWTGTVARANADVGGPFNFSNLVNGSLSKVQMRQVQGWLDENSSTNANIVLYNGATQYGFCVNVASDGKEYTFSGNFSGEGDFVYNDENNCSPTYNFSGNLSEWTGKFNLKENGTGTTTVNVTSTGNINAGFKNSSTKANTLELIFSSNSDQNINGEVTTSSKNNTLNMTLNGTGTKTIGANVTANNLTIINSNGAEITISGNRTINVGNLNAYKDNNNTLSELNINMNAKDIAAKLGENESCVLISVTGSFNASSLTINGHENVTVGDYDYYISYNDNAITLSRRYYSRNVTSGNFGSICLPNGAKVSQMTGVAKVLEVTEITTDRVNMIEVEEMTPGVPYIFKSNASAINLTLKGETAPEPNNSTQNYLVGNFETPVFVPISDNSNTYYILQSNQFRKVTEASTIKSGSNRCYLKVPVTPSSSRQAILGIDIDEDSATGIDAINSLKNNDAEIYDLNGRRLNDLRKGINIVNGVKVIVK